MSREQRRRVANRPPLAPERLEGRALLSTAKPHLSVGRHLAAEAVAKGHPVESAQLTSTGSSRFHLDLRRKDILFFPDAVQPPSTALSPAQLDKAYGIDQLSQKGQGMTIAIVDPNDDPKIASDVATFSQIYNLPQLDGLNGDGTFTKAEPDGRPLPNNSSAVEISLDVEWVHAVAPLANILLVESRNFSDIFNADLYAEAQPGVVAVSNSWAGGETSNEATDDSVFLAPNGHTPVAFTFSTGDSGAPAGYPSFSPNVVAVGGTSLYLNSNGTYNHESAWSGSGGSVSLYENSPTFQSGLGYSKRAVPDVSSDADPNTGVAVYDSYLGHGWIQVGGTSLSAPTWGALIGLAQQARIANHLTPLSSSGVNAKLYAAYHSANQYAADFHDVTTGNNGNSAGTGYDLATGIGSPKAVQIVSLLSASA